MEVGLGKRAYLDIENYIAYIISEGYPLTAYKFQKRLINFCYQLGYNPEKYPACRFKVLNLKNYRCAVFAKNYIMAYKITGNSVTVMRIIHTSRLKA